MITPMIKKKECLISNLDKLVYSRTKTVIFIHWTLISVLKFVIIRTFLANIQWTLYSVDGSSLLKHKRIFSDHQWPRTKYCIIFLKPHLQIKISLDSSINSQKKRKNISEIIAPNSELVEIPSICDYLLMSRTSTSRK